MTIDEKIIPVNKYNRPGTASTPKRIAIHYTGDVGASAERLALFYKNVAAGLFVNYPANWTSAQYIVGTDGEIIRIIPDNEMSYAVASHNSGTISIEICYNDASGKFTDKSITAAGELVRSLMSKYKISAENVLRHYDITGKLCPYYYVDETRWAALKKSLLQAETKTLYRVQIGAFSSKTNAENYLKQARAAGFNGFIVGGE